MKRKGPFPILKYTDGKNTAQFEINKPLMLVGRDKNMNSICIPNQIFQEHIFQSDLLTVNIGLLMKIVLME